MTDDRALWADLLFGISMGHLPGVQVCGAAACLKPLMRRSPAIVSCAMIWSRICRARFPGIIMRWHISSCASPPSGGAVSRASCLGPTRVSAIRASEPPNWQGECMSAISMLPAGRSLMTHCAVSLDQEDSPRARNQHGAAKVVMTDQVREVGINVKGNATAHRRPCCVHGIRD